MGPEIGPAQKIGKKLPKNRESAEIQFLGYFFLFSGRDLFPDPFRFPILGRRPKTYFLAGRMGRKQKGSTWQDLWTSILRRALGSTRQREIQHPHFAV